MSKILPGLTKDFIWRDTSDDPKMAWIYQGPIRLEEADWRFESIVARKQDDYSLGVLLYRNQASGSWRYFLADFSTEVFIREVLPTGYLDVQRDFLAFSAEGDYIYFLHDDLKSIIKERVSDGTTEEFLFNPTRESYSTVSRIAMLQNRYLVCGVSGSVDEPLSTKSGHVCVFDINTNQFIYRKNVEVKSPIVEMSSEVNSGTPLIPTIAAEGSYFYAYVSPLVRISFQGGGNTTTYDSYVDSIRCFYIDNGVIINSFNKEGYSRVSPLINRTTEIPGSNDTLYLEYPNKYEVGDDIFVFRQDPVTGDWGGWSTTVVTSSGNLITTSGYGSPEPATDSIFYTAGSSGVNGIKENVDLPLNNVRISKDGRYLFYCGLDAGDFLSYTKPLTQAQIDDKINNEIIAYKSNPSKDRSLNRYGLFIGRIDAYAGSELTWNKDCYSTDQRNNVAGFAIGDDPSKVFVIFHNGSNDTLQDSHQAVLNLENNSSIFNVINISQDIVEPLKASALQSKPVNEQSLMARLSSPMNIIDGNMLPGNKFLFNLQLAEPAPPADNNFRNIYYLGDLTKETLEDIFQEVYVNKFSEPHEELRKIKVAGDTFRLGAVNAKYRASGEIARHYLSIKRSTGEVFLNRELNPANFSLSFERDFSPLYGVQPSVGA